MITNSQSSRSNTARILTSILAVLLLAVFLAPDSSAQIRAKKKFKKRNQSGPVQDRQLDEVTAIRTTGFDPSDIEPMAQQMVRDILSSPAFRRAVEAESDDPAKPPDVVRIALRPIKNYTSQRIDPEIITRRIENFLIRESAGRIQFLARELSLNEAGIPQDVQIEEQLRRSGKVDSAPGRKLASADFFLKGEVREQQTVTAGGRDRLVQYTFWLESTETLVKVWQNQYITRRTAVKDGAYR